MIQPAKFVVYHPKTIIVVTLAITLGYLAAILIRGISFNGSPETLARKDESFRFYDETRLIFGDDRVIVVGITTNDVFTVPFLVKLTRLTNRLAATRGVDQALSLTNVKAIRKEEGGNGVSIGRLIDSRVFNEVSADYLDKLREEVTGDPLYALHYVSTDGKTAGVDVFLKPLSESQTREVAEEVERIARAEAGEDEVFLSGVPVVDARGIQSMLRDMLVLSPAAAILCFFVFLLTFRTIWGAALPMAALIIGLVWTIGMMSMLGRPITLATLSLPTTMMAVGSSYMFHVLNQYRLSMSTRRSEARSKHRAWLEGLTFIGPAVIVSGTATMAGFGALASSSVPTARDMGIFEALGVLAMLVLTIAFIPAALSALPRNALGQVRSRRDYASWLNRPLSSVTALALFRRRSVLLLTLAATLALGSGAMWLRVDTDYLHIFPSGSETVRDAEKLHERLAGAATVQLVMTGGRNAVTDPRFLRTVSELERFAMKQPGVDAALSVADIIARINSVLGNHSDVASHSVIPEDSRELESIFHDYLSQDESISRLVTPDGSRAVIVLRVNLFSSNELRALTRAIADWAGQNVDTNVSVRPTGSIILLNNASDAVAESQASSLAIALVTIYLMMVALFRSFATSLLALTPNLLPIVCYFGFLGWSGTPLDLTSSLVASAVLGLAVDNAVHMIRRYRQSAAEGRDGGWTMWLTMLRTGKPMVLANLMLIAAFLVFVLSSFVPLRIAGVLWALTIAACLAADLIFLPALIKTRLFARIALGKN